MRHALLAVVLLCALPASASDIYVAQTSVGGNTGADCADARANSSLVSGDWSPGNTIHLCGAIAPPVTALGSGTSGSKITIHFEAGSSITAGAIPASGGIVLTSLSWIVVDGGGGSCGWSWGGGNVTCSQGIIESTANGTGLANQIASVAIYAQNATNIEVKGLQIGPLYNHTSTSDLAITAPGAVCALFQGGAHWNIHNNTLHDITWCVDGGSATGDVVVVNNFFDRFDHGLGMGGPNTAIVVHDNHFGSSVNWDTSNGSLHHDPIHLWGTTGNANTNAQEYNNLFDGDPGVGWTSDIYNEGLDTGFLMYNNVAIVSAGRFPCCGVISFYGNGFTGDHNSAYNNTVIGAYVSGSGSCLGLQTNTNLTIENNSLYGCNGIIGWDAGSSILTVDRNAYEDVGTDHGIGAAANTFGYPSPSNQSASFTSWKTNCSCDSHSQFGTTSQFAQNSNGTFRSGSFLSGNGANLSGLSITTLNSDAQGNARPGGATAWDIGAFFGAQSASSFVTPVSAINP